MTFRNTIGWALAACGLLVLVIPLVVCIPRDVALQLLTMLALPLLAIVVGVSLTIPRH